MSVSKEIRDIVHSLRLAGMENEAETLMLLSSKKITVVELASALEEIRSILRERGLSKGLSVYKYDDSHIAIHGVSPFAAGKVRKAVISNFNSKLPVGERKLKPAPDVKVGVGTLALRLY